MDFPWQCLFVLLACIPLLVHAQCSSATVTSADGWSMYIGPDYY